MIEMSSAILMALVVASFTLYVWAATRSGKEEDDDE